MDEGHDPHSGIPPEDKFPRVNTNIQFGIPIGGAENDVYKDYDTGLCTKIPKEIGYVWQEMSEAISRKDIDILEKYGIPFVPTIVSNDTRVFCAGKEMSVPERMIQEPVELVRKTIMGIHDDKTVSRMRAVLSKRLEKPIRLFRKLYENIVGLELIDLAKYILRKEKFVFGKRMVVKYRLIQPIFEPSHAMTFGDLVQEKKYVDLVYKCISKSEEMLKNPDEQRGLDLLGGKAFRLILPAINPFCKAMRAEISNLLVADGEIRVKQPWKGVPEGGVIAEKGDAMLVDTGLYKLAPKPGFLSWLKLKILKSIQEFQNGALWSIVESFGEHEVPKERFKSIPRKIAHFLFGIALPKMRRGAEEK